VMPVTTASGTSTCGGGVGDGAGVGLGAGGDAAALWSVGALVGVA
jgi:hypothetical protein